MPFEIDTGNHIGDQRSVEWFLARLGKVTGSRVADLMAKTKTGYSASRANYMADLLCERLTGAACDRYTSVAMQWGIDTESHARKAYIASTGENVQEVGFIQHPFILAFGASPDGMVGNDGLIEIKCPNTATHIETVLSRVVPQKYFTQVQAQMACAGRLWCDFVSYDPRLPTNMQLFIQRVERDNAYIAVMETEIQNFLSELDAKVSVMKLFAQGK